MWFNSLGENSNDVKHTGSIRSLSIYRDVKSQTLRLVSCGDELVITWDLKSTGKGKHVCYFQNVHPACITHVQAVPNWPKNMDGQEVNEVVLFTSSVDETILISKFHVDLKSKDCREEICTLGKQSMFFTTSMNVRVLTDYPDGRSRDYILAAKSDHTVDVIDFTTGKVVKSFGVPTNKLNLQFKAKSKTKNCVVGCDFLSCDLPTVSCEPTTFFNMFPGICPDEANIKVQSKNLILKPIFFFFFFF